MRRGILVAWQVATLVVAACLYFFFVLPRWPEFAGQTSHTLGTAMRIVTGVLVVLAAAPVAYDLVKKRPPEFGTPQLALALRAAAIIGHALAGLMIIGAAVTEIWVGLENAGQILFGVYGAAAALAVLSAGAFYLAFAAETTPAPPKPLQPPKPLKPLAPETVSRDGNDDPVDAGEGGPPVFLISESDSADIAEPALDDAATNRPVSRRLRNRREAKSSPAALSKDD
jgi:hypothetical protein